MAENAIDKMVLRTESLVKIYGKRTVVNDVSISVKQGEIVGLLGPNGAGKTTTFYMTTGLVIPNKGKCFINDIVSLFNPLNNSRYILSLYSNFVIYVGQISKSSFIETNACANSILFTCLGPIIIILYGSI